jgi:hypothetical protein
MKARSRSAALSRDIDDTSVYGASGRAWSDALMIVGRLSADPAIGGPFGYDSAAVLKRKTG